MNIPIELRAAPYRAGGRSAAGGVDCLGFVQIALSLPANHKPCTLADISETVDTPAAGDVIVAYYQDTPVHVGIVLDSGDIAHFTRNGYTVESMQSFDPCRAYNKLEYRRVHQCY